MKLCRRKKCHCCQLHRFLKWPLIKSNFVTIMIASKSGKYLIDQIRYIEKPKIIFISLHILIKSIHCYLDVRLSRWKRRHCIFLWTNDHNGWWTAVKCLQYFPSINLLIHLVMVTLVNSSLSCVSNSIFLFLQIIFRVNALRITP